ncbi:MAG: hypothetical protein IJD45_00895 [Clostridia bacterium]|nr:hypothetical protein [Clostridia bacterium]
MKKIGFVDYYLSEWHANNYPTWINMANEKLSTDFVLSYAWAEKDISPFDKITTDEWCEKFGVVKCDSIEELCEKSDYILILSPSNPETHLRYAKAVLPFKKPTYIDKTFAPDYETAKQIFQIAKQYKTPFFTTSALRYAEELESLKGLKNAIITGGGGNFHEYMIHPIEIFVSLFSDRATSVKVETMGANKICRIKTLNGYEASIIYSPQFTFSVTAQMGEEKFCKKEVTSEFFLNLIEEMMTFFKTEKEPFDPMETLEVMRIRDALINAEKNDNVWLEI